MSKKRFDAGIFNDNVCWSKTSDAVFIDDGVKIKITNNKLIGMGGHGLNIGSDIKAEIDNNEAVGYKGDGIHIRDKTSKAKGKSFTWMGSTSKKDKGGLESSPKIKWLSRILEHPVIAGLIVATIIGLFGFVNTFHGNDQPRTQEKPRPIKVSIPDKSI